MSQTASPEMQKPVAAATRPTRSIVTIAPRSSAGDRVRRRRRSRQIDNLLRFGVPIALVLLWQLGAVTEAFDRRFFPAPVDVWDALKVTIETGLLQDSLMVSGSRLLQGFLYGAVIGLVTGFVLGRVRRLRVALEPIISALYTVPKLAVLPILLLIFGLGDTPMIILIAASVFFIVVISTTAAVGSVAENYLEPAAAFGATRLQLLRHVIIPAILPAVFVALRLAAGTAVLVLIGIEFVQSGEGIGWMIWNSWQVFAVGRMYVGVVIVAIFGVLFQAAITGLGRLLTPWTRTGDRS